MIIESIVLGIKRFRYNISMPHEGKSELTGLTGIIYRIRNRLARFLEGSPSLNDRAMKGPQNKD